MAVEFDVGELSFAKKLFVAEKLPSAPNLFAGTSHAMVGLYKFIYKVTQALEALHKFRRRTHIYGNNPQGKKSQSVQKHPTEKRFQKYSK